MNRIQFVEDIEHIIREKNIKLVSFDVFDTLIFRMVIQPTDVFTLVGNEAIDSRILPSHLTGEDYKNIRIKAEQEARRIKNNIEHITEINFEEIFNAMPSFYKNKEELSKLEFKMENMLCYANPIMEKVLEKLKDIGVPYVLTSDMYFNKDQIQELLISSGFEERFSIIVSSEYKKAKSDGLLFNILIDKYQIRAEEILHIGDNYNSDYILAKKCGLNAIYYDMLSDQKFKGLFYEKMLYPENLPEIYAMRRYLPFLYNSEYKEDIWYLTGVQIYGPLLTMMCEWILDTAIKENIYKIYPLMREGKIFTQLLRYAAKDRELDISIEPLYISRRAVYIPSLNKITKDKIEQILNVPFTTLHNVMKLMGIQEKEQEFRDIYGDGKDIDYIQMAENLYDYMQKPEITHLFQQYRKKELDNAFGYYSEKGLTDPFITVDIGFHGTIQMGLEKILDLKNVKNHNIHLLGFSPKGSVNALYHNTDLRGFLGNCGQNDELNTYIVWHPRLLEQSLMCDEGSTKSYALDDGNYVPVKGNVDRLIVNQVEKTKKLQQGIMDFQKEYLRLKKRKPVIVKCENRRIELTNAYVRLVKLPTYLEAVSFGDIVHDENYGVDASYTFCDKEKIEKIKKEGWNSYSSQNDILKEYWIEGLRTIAEPGYEFNKLCNLVRDNLYIGMSMLANQISSNLCRNEKIVIIGAGNAGKTLKKFLEVFGVGVEAFVDNKKELQGTFFNGIPIVSMSHTFESKYFALGTLAFVDVLLSEANAILNDNATIFIYKEGVVSKTIVNKKASVEKW